MKRRTEEGPGSIRYVPEGKKKLKGEKDNVSMNKEEYILPAAEGQRSKILASLLSNSASDKRKWEEAVSEEKKSGRLTLEEVAKLKAALYKYAYEKDLGESGVLKLVSEKATKDTLGAWTHIAECLPNRSVQSCHNLCRRRFNPNNYGGKWSQEEVQQLCTLVAQHGRKWKMIAETLERTETNVRDKYRQIGEEGSANRVRFWSVQELVKLVKMIGKECGVKLFNRRKELKKELKSRCEELNFESQKSSLQHIRIRSLKYIDANTKFLLQYVNFEGFRQLGNARIPWTSIAERLPAKSKDDVKNKWMQYILRVVFGAKDFFQEAEDEEQDLLERIFKQQPTSEKEIEFAAIDNGRTPKENKEKWLSLKMRVTSKPNAKIPKMLTDLIASFENYKKPSNTQKTSVSPSS